MSGRIIVNTGDGKGKTTAAVGMAVRAVGRGLRVAFFQFIKGSIPTGETEPLERLGIEVGRLGRGYVFRKEAIAEDQRLAREGWRRCAQALADPEVGLVVLDEINVVLHLGFLEIQEVLEALGQRPPAQHVVLTGRGLHPALAELADTVTEMVPIKHAYQAGVTATEGVEF